MPLQVQDSDKMKLEMHCSVRGLRIVTGLGERCMTVPLQVQSRQ